MKQCPYCNSQIADNSRFCSKCGKPMPERNVCPHCGALTKEGGAFCSNCGKSLKQEATITDPTKEKKVYSEGRTKSRFKKYLPYILGAVAIIAICCGSWRLLRSNNDNTNEPFETEPFETSLVSFKKTAEFLYHDYGFEVEINVDFPIKGNPELLTNVRTLLIDALTKGLLVEMEPRFEGDVSNGQSIVDFYGNEKIKELQERDGIASKFTFLKTYETDKLVSYTINYNGTLGDLSKYVETYGVSFDKANGTRIQVIKSPNDMDFRNFLISKVMSHLEENKPIGLVYEESILRAKIYPQNAPFLTKDGVCFKYKISELGDEALGRVEVIIPYNSIRSYMSETALSVIGSSADDGQNLSKEEEK